MRLTYFGHSAFLLEAAGLRFVFDPWLSRNPHGPIDPAQLPCDFVLCSHAHDDHCADALPLARAHGATIVAPFELAEYFAAQGAATLDLMPGGGKNFPWGRIAMTPAIHSSSLELPGGENKPMGVAAGFVAHVQHAGERNSARFLVEPDLADFIIAGAHLAHDRRGRRRFVRRLGISQGSECAEQDGEERELRHSRQRRRGGRGAEPQLSRCDSAACA